eukprot:2549885-Amphidinium_carterae.1
MAATRRPSNHPHRWAVGRRQQWPVGQQMFQEACCDVLALLRSVKVEKAQAHSPMAPRVPSPRCQ